MPPTPDDPLVRVVVIAYEAETTIEAVLDRMPHQIEGARLEIQVADDGSSDHTVDRVLRWQEHAGRVDVSVRRRERNLGYGGNQIAAYLECLRDHIDVVAVVHGDGQYPPEQLEQLIRPILSGRADVVSGSRMLIRGGALDGGMPMARYVGNRLLSACQNLLTGVHLSEWHSGFRCYRVRSLGDIDLRSLPVGFDFDTAITLELVGTGARVAEIAIPTHYGSEVSRINPYRTGVRILGHTVRWSRRRRWARHLGLS